MYYKIPKLQARMYIWAAVTTASLPHNEDMCNILVVSSLSPPHAP